MWFIKPFLQVGSVQDRQRWTTEFFECKLHINKVRLWKSWQLAVCQVTCVFSCFIKVVINNMEITQSYLSVFLQSKQSINKIMMDWSKIYHFSLHYVVKLHDIVIIIALIQNYRRLSSNRLRRQHCTNIHNHSNVLKHKPETCLVIF